MSTDLAMVIKSFDEVFSVGSIGHWKLDLLSTSESWSPECYQLRGLDSHDSRDPAVIFRETLHPDDKDRVLHELATSTVSSDFALRFRAVTTQGEIRNLVRTSNPIASSQAIRVGSEFCLTPTLDLVTSCSKSMRPYVEAIEYNIQATVVVDENFNVLIWNAAAEAMTGLRANAQLGKQLPDLQSEVSTKNSWTIEQLRQEVFKSPTGTLTRRGWRQRPNGNRYYGESRYTAIRDRENRVEYVVIQIADISWGAMKVSTLPVAEAVIRDAPVGVMMTTTSGLIAYMNPKIQEMLGISAEQAVGRMTTDSFHPPGNFEDPNVTKAVVDDPLPRSKKELLTRRIVTGEVNIERFLTDFVRVDGSRFPVELSITPLRDQEGMIEGFVGLSLDVTERERALQSVRDSLAENQRISRELEAANSKLREINDDLETFSHIIAHDLTEPLRAVSACAELLVESSGHLFDERGTRFANLLIHESTRIQSMITDLRQFSRIDRNDFPLQIVDLNEVLTEVILNLESTYSEIHEVLAIGELPEISGDFSYAVSIFQNLIGNSFKFRSDIPLKISVSAERDWLQQEWRITVSDNGVGIPLAERSRIFEMFRRGSAAQGKPGSGMGLAICKRITERFGGRIRLEDSADSGTKIVLTFPAIVPSDISKGD